MLFSRRPGIDEFEAAAMPHMNAIYRTASRLQDSTAEVDGIVQNVYLHAWKSFGQFKLGTGCRVWLFRILFDTLRRRGRSPNIRLVSDRDATADEIFGSPPMPEHVTDDEILGALAEVPRDSRAAVLLIDVEEFSYQEAARILDVPVSTVMSNLSRGRKTLRKELASLTLSFGMGSTPREGKIA